MRLTFILTLFIFIHNCTASAVPISTGDGKARRKVAIIGAGAGGSSAAFWILKAKQRSGLDIDVDIYERSDYIGGRSTVVHPRNDRKLRAIELGGSIFVPANLNLMRATKEFNLSFVPLTPPGMGDIGLWDGKQMVLSLKDDETDLSVIDKAYGLASLAKAKSLVSAGIALFLKLYERNATTWRKLTQLSDFIQVTELTKQTATKYFASQGVSTKYISGLMEGIVRISYGQNVHEISAFGARVGIAVDGETSILGGDYQIFEQFVKRSGAKVHLDTEVEEISRVSNGGSLKWRVETDDVEKTYDAVIIAAPFHQTDISFPRDIEKQVPEQPYVYRHVTLFTTSSERPNPQYFNLPANAKVEHMVFTTYEGARRGGKEPEFDSLTYQGLVEPGVHAYKFFSEKRISDNLLGKLFKDVKWVHRKQWDAFPVFKPGPVYSPIKLDTGLYYVNAFESFMSTMETATIASRNVVDMMFQDQFGSGLCPTSTPRSNSTNFVYGWDC